MRREIARDPNVSVDQIIEAILDSPIRPGCGKASTQAAPATTLNCWDVQGLARRARASNPGIDDDTLYQTILQMQVMMGCRPEQPSRPILAPQQVTRCGWEFREWVCRTD